MYVDRSIGGQPLSVQISRAVSDADADDEDPSELAPLGTVVDATAIEQLFRGRDSGTVTFGYRGHTVAVRSGEIEVRDSSPVSDRTPIQDSFGPVHYVESFDVTSEPASLSVVSAVATAAETPAASLPPLYSAVDPDALDDLLRSAASRPKRPVSVSFVYHGHPVTVDETGVVAVRQSESLARSAQ